MQEDRGRKPEEETQRDGEVVESLAPVEECLVKRKGNSDGVKGDVGMQSQDEGLEMEENKED